MLRRTLQRGSKQASTRLKQLNKPLLVCFSHLRWDFVYQRPQHLLSRAAHGYRVVFIEEPIYRDGIEACLDVSDRPGGVAVVVPHLPTGLSPESSCEALEVLIGAFLQQLPASQRLFWYYTPMAMAFSRSFEADVVVYDNMDELSAFRGASAELLALEKELFVKADVIFTGGMSLYEAKRSLHPNVHGFPSSIDFDHFVKARKRDLCDPQDQARIPHPRLGFFGVVDERMDVDLVAASADLKPEWQFVMIGPVVKIDPVTLPRRANLHWLGGKSYKELPYYLAHWDVGFMPFAINEATRFISPTKTPEFLSAGVPVVSTPIADVVRPYGNKGLVEIASTAQEVVASAEKLLSISSRDRWLQSVDVHLAATSWDKTWASMDALIKKSFAAKQAKFARLLQGKRPALRAATPVSLVGATAGANHV